MNTINETKEYHKNPRKITKKQHELLNDSLTEFGDLSGIVVNVRTGEVIGGNQRSSIFRKKNAKIEIIQHYGEPTETGTTAVGFVVVDGEKYAYREVSWDEAKSESANVRANKIGGMFDFDILANQFDIEILMESGFDESELGFAKIGDLNLDRDESDLDDRLDTFMNSTIKQIVLYFGSEQYEQTIEKLEKIQKEIGVDNNTDAIIHILKYYEDNNR